MTKLWYVVSVLVLVVHTYGAPSPEEVPTPELPSPPEQPPTDTSSPVPPLLANGELAVPDCKNTTDVYDMSQNGSENYKVNVKGFTFLLAGSDTVLGAAMLMSGLADADKNNPAAPGAAAASNPATPENSDKMSKLMQLIKQISHGGRSIKVNLLNNQEGEKQYKRFLRNIK